MNYIKLNWRHCILIKKFKFKPNLQIFPKQFTIKMKNCWLTFWIEVREEEPDVVVEGGREVDVGRRVQEDLGKVDLVPGPDNFDQQRNANESQIKTAKQFCSSHFTFRSTFDVFLLPRSDVLNWQMKMKWRRK